MKGDTVIIREDFRRIACEIVSCLLAGIRQKEGRYILTISGESGSGKTVASHAIAEELTKFGVASVILSQDDYFVLPPKTNDRKRRADPNWLGPHVEVRLDWMDRNLKEAIQGHAAITKPLVDYYADSIGEETIDLSNVKVIIAEGTYTSLLKSADTRIFIERTWLDTRADRLKRNRGSEAQDPFVEGVLVTEHKIIAGHRFLADFLVTTDFKVVKTQ